MAGVYFSFEQGAREFLFLSVDYIRITSHFIVGITYIPVIGSLSQARNRFFPATTVRGLSS